jgi:hypothetical protein
MEELVLNDKTVVPTDELIFSIIGENSRHWQKLMQHVYDNYPGSEGRWKYYNDGKNWLFSMIRKKKTLFWIGVHKDTFRITFYFGDKAEPIIEKSNLPTGMKEDFKTSKRYGKIRAATLRVEKEADIDNAIMLLEIKDKI